MAAFITDMLALTGATGLDVLQYIPIAIVVALGTKTVLRVVFRGR